MAFQKFNKVESAKVLSPQQHEAVETELHKLGKTSAAGLTEEERENLKMALESSNETR